MIGLDVIGVAACWAGCGALAVAAHRSPRRAAPGALAPAARLDVSAVEEVPASAGAGALDPACPYGSNTAATGVTYTYCPAELRVSPHSERDDGELWCWGCPEGDA
ncbi:hypothetical protein ACKI16_29805 [Streptomyces scabiei]|uniref:hypothetical protein n=1 Tax=Streptomyces scabiei TaxID=1930 RepID=UPI0038F78838